MAEIETAPIDREERFQEAAAEYVQALESGREVDAQQVLYRHPDLADDLAAFLAGQEHMARWAALRELAGASPSAPFDPDAALILRRDAPTGAVAPPSGCLGDFRLLREVGRGGMGVVYEAEQISLDRRVALKVLPFAATMDPRHIQRFHNEARAAASLHHTNIVPVFGVGTDRGVHYYAM
jgi:hypothetical protein